MDIINGILKKVKYISLRVGEWIKGMWRKFNSLNEKKKILICSCAFVSVILIVLASVCISHSVKMSNIADEYLHNLELGNFDDVAMVTNYSYGESSNIDVIGDPMVSTTDLSIIPTIMKNSAYYRSLIITMGNSAKFKITVQAPDMYQVVISLPELEGVDLMSESDIRNILIEAANNPDSDVLETTISVEVKIHNGKPVFYLEESLFMDAISGDLTKGYRELYMQALQEMIDYMGGNGQ